MKKYEIRLAYKKINVIDPKIEKVNDFLSLVKSNSFIGYVKNKNIKKIKISQKDGESNVDGADGLQGIAGAAGVDGADGLQGIAGAAGVDGADGLQGIAGAAGDLPLNNGDKNGPDEQPIDVNLKEIEEETKTENGPDKSDVVVDSKSDKKGTRPKRKKDKG